MTANYKQPATANSRVRFYDGQFLQDQDFIDEQKYHIDRQQRHNCSLHVAGIVSGLEVNAAKEKNQLQVTPGIAIDPEGRQIVLSQPQNVPVEIDGWLYIVFGQTPGLMQTSKEGARDYTRWEETPLLFLSGKEIQPEIKYDLDKLLWKSLEKLDWELYLENVPPPPVFLGKVSVTDGKVTADLSGRVYSGVRLPAPGNPAEAAVLRADASGTVSLSVGNLETMRITGNGNVGIGHSDPKDRLHVQGSLRVTGDAAIAQNLSVNGRLYLENGVIQRGGKTLIEKTTDLGLYSQVPGHWMRFVTNKAPFVFYADGDEGKDPIMSLEVNGNLRARTITIRSTNPNQHRMYPADPIIFQDIFDARNKGVIGKLGSPAFNDTDYAPGKNPWYGRHIILFGGNEEKEGDGAWVDIPKGYDTVWVRILGERWNRIWAYLCDKHGNKAKDLGHWTGGYREANLYCPDGSLSDGLKFDKGKFPVSIHQWLPIPVGQSGRLALISKSPTSDLFWISGLAFSRNPWAHACQSAVGIHWAVNGGNQTFWDPNGYYNWNGDILTRLDTGSNLELKVPVIGNGRDKLLYLVEHNSNWSGAYHTGISVNESPVERLLSTYDNPFSRHWNSKIYNRYLACRVPASLIAKPGVSYLSVRIDLTRQTYLGLHLREIGTHDLEVPE